MTEVGDAGTGGPAVTALARSRVAVARPRRWRARTSRWLLYAPLILWSAATIWPFAFLALLSVRSLNDLYLHPFSLPHTWAWANYAAAWTGAHVARYALNSAIVSVGTTLLVLLTATPAAFALSRFSFRGRGLIWSFILLGMFIPALTELVPIVIIAHDLHIDNSLQGLILIYAGGGIPFAVFLIATFMRSLPVELEEVAVVDGASTWRVFREVMVPLSRPALITVATFTMLDSWAEYIIARLLITSPNRETLPLGLSGLMDQYSTQIPTYAAGVVIAITPAVAMFVFLQRYVVSGLTDGAIRA